MLVGDRMNVKDDSQNWILALGSVRPESGEVCGGNLFLDSHSSLLMKKELVGKQGQKLEQADRREIFRENQANQEGSKNEKNKIIRENLLEAKRTK